MAKSANSKRVSAEADSTGLEFGQSSNLLHQFALSNEGPLYDAAICMARYLPQFVNADLPILQSR